uniref:Ankyrin repeat domain 49 n=1 Tax=Macaca fascicularis TaxID=9541 RepID=A0A7N9D455_MACFA
MEKEKGNDDGIPDQENSLDFSEHFNQLELLETHGHLIPTGTQSLWVGNSDEDEEQDDKNEEWYRLQEKKMEKDPSKLLLWAAEKNRVKKKDYRRKCDSRNSTGFKPEGLPLLLWPSYLSLDCEDQMRQCT